MWLPRSAALKSIHQLFHSQGLARLDLPVLMTATVLRDVVLHDDDFEDFLDLQATQSLDIVGSWSQNSQNHNIPGGGIRSL